ncbi:cytochrome P450 [Abortiporus biennis]|nr:cytochrome P450 [Abortiporus biennis]
MLGEVVCLVVLSVVFHSFFRRYQYHARRRGVPLPPGPPQDPLVGHLFKAPRAFQEDMFADLAKKYGDVVYLTVLGKELVILNTEQAALDLLEKRSLMYSNRPLLPLADMMGWGDCLAFLQYGPTFQSTRRLFQQALTKGECLKYREVQLRQARIMVQNFLNSPMEIETNMLRFANAIITEVTYGHKIMSGDDPYVARVDELFDILNGMGDPGGTIIDVFPILRYIPAWFPGAWYAKYARKYRPRVTTIVNEPFNEVKKSIAAGTAEPSFMALHLEQMQHQDDVGEDDIRRLKIAGFQLYGAGGETTSSSLFVFLLAMVHNPQVQKRAQAEIDRVVGNQRLPDFNDRDSMPYITAMVNEVVRWKPVVPLSLPHCATTDDVYNGMFIPKGATMIPNVRHILKNPDVYHDPHSFEPERFLPKPEGYGEPLPHIAFGFGRRGCPGRVLAEATLWIGFASILAAFDIVPIKDTQGNDILPPMDFNVYLTSRPKPFECTIRPRSAQHASLIENGLISL